MPTTLDILPQSSTDRLWCALGQHYWERSTQRGRKPLSCPDHRPEPNFHPMSVEARQVAMAQGREKATRQRVENAVARVRAFKAWLKRESAAYANITDDRSTWVAALSEIPLAMPNDYDYRLAREAEKAR
jgi:hypothetical protein